MRIACPLKCAKGGCIASLGSLRELHGNTNVVLLSESPGSTSTCTVSLGSPTIVPSKLTKELGLGITYNDGYGHGVFHCSSFRPFSFDFYFLV
jgi:hypothetical protein